MCVYTFSHTPGYAHTDMSFPTFFVKYKEVKIVLLQTIEKKKNVYFV